MSEGVIFKTGYYTYIMTKKDINIEQTVESSTPVFDSLNPRQQQFIINYIEKRVAYKAYQDAYSTKQKQLSREVCDVNASNLLRKPKIKQALQEKFDHYWSNRDQVISKIFDELQAIAFSDVSTYVDSDGNLKNISNLDTRAIKSITKTDTDKSSYSRIELHSKQAALQELADILQIKKQRIELSGQIVYLDKQDSEL